MLMMLGRQKCNSFEVKIATEELRSNKSRGIHQILAEVIKARGNTLCCEIQKPINSIQKKNYHSNHRGISLLVTTTKFYQIVFSQG
jgi:hypothetical protein